jgi:uncharacterized protein (DUF2062 family)
MTNQPITGESALARFRRWLWSHHFRLINIKDTPHSIALGLAIGIFFGFTPLLSLKTLLSIGVAWVCKSNKIAAAISVTLHDLLLPFMPAIYLWEYKVGFWALHGQMPQRFSLHRLALWDYLKWTTFFTVVRPILVGSVILGLPFAALIYFLCRGIVARAQHARR